MRTGNLLATTWSGGVLALMLNLPEAALVQGEVVPLRRIQSRGVVTQPGATDKGSLRGVLQESAPLAVLEPQQRAYYALLDFNGDQELLALVDTASSSLAVLVQSPSVPPLAAENETATKEDVFNDPDCLSKRPLTPLGANQTGPSQAPPMAPGLSSSNARTVNAEAAQAHSLPCDDHRCVGDCVPGAWWGCGPFGGACRTADGTCAFSLLAMLDDQADHLPQAAAGNGVVMEGPLRVGQWQLSHALFGAVPRSSLMHTAVLGLAYAHNTTFPSPSPIANKAHRKAPHPSPPPPPTNTTPAALPPKPLSTCPPHSSCTPPLLDQILEADRTAEDKWALCMDGEAGALVLGGGDRTLCVDGKVDGTVPLLRPRGGSHEGQQYWVRVRGLRLGEVGVAPELFHNAEGEEDDEGCANATTVSNLPGAVKNGTLTGMQNGGRLRPSHWGVVTRALIDSGSGDLALPAPLFDALRRHCEDTEGHTGRRSIIPPSLAGTARAANLFDGLAVRVTEEELSSMPILEVVLEQGISLLLGPGQYLMHRQVVVESGDGKGGDYYSLRVVRDDHFVLGLAALEGHYLEVDRQSRSLSLGRAVPNCLPPPPAQLPEPIPQAAVSYHAEPAH